MKVFVPLLVVVGLQLAVAQPPCPADQPQVSCLVDPCMFARCPNIDGATCETDYCGGCFAKFYNADGEEVTEMCEVTTECRIEGQEYTDCGSACPLTCASPDPSVCIDLCIPGCQCPLGEYLDEAADTCVDNLEDCSNDTSPCPPGVPIVLCIADPCEVTRCPSYPDAECESDFCGGCNARFYTDDETEVTDSCENSTSTCPPGVPLVQCFANPCEVTRCPNYPDAMCLADYCGGCNAIFYDENGEDVSDMCEGTDTGFLSCPPLSSDTIGLCFEGCSSNSDCSEGELCCSNGCGHTCQDAVTIPYYEPPLQCPNVTGLFGVCIVGCTADSVCSNDGDLCCSNGCGTQCTPGETPYPLCPLIKERASADSTGLVGAYIPQCQDDGNFSPVQCHGSTGYCWCVNVRTGVPISDLVAPGVDISCTMCSYLEETYNVGEVFPAGDDCNTCTCGRNGLPSCTRIGCPSLNATCEYRGQVYVAGQDFPAGDGCNRCSCTPTGAVACTEIACPTATGNGTCRFGDREYELGDTFPAGDDCNTCGCTASGVICTLIYCPVNVTCEYEGREYAAGESFPADDGCNTCFCGPTGFVACTLAACFDICSLEPDPGPCDAYVPSYYYNPTSEECEIFIYGGCGGNENRFQTIGECLKRCDQDSICLLDPEVGPCEAIIPSYFFNADTGQCEMFDYGGCDGNENRFETLEECARACAAGCEYEGVIYQFGDEFPADDNCNKCFCEGDGSVTCTEMDCPEDCELDPEPGLCLAYFPSYFYNSTSEQCESFIYGGCGGNDNRFETVRECLRECDPDSICLSEPEEGDCNFITPSYFYNATSGRCEEVAYTNCGVNRFATEERCIERCNPDVCEYDERFYYPGDSFDAGDDCNQCFCDRSGYVFCTDAFCVTCEYEGEEYIPGDSFTAEDDCNTCRCTAAGNIVCTDIFCPEPCDDGQPQVFCFVDPCEVATCPLIPDARCEADYCGGCNARFYMSDDDDVDEVTDSCSGPCPDGTLEVDCFLDPCQFARCPGFPEATCRADYCGGCNARFYDGDREVTEECETCPDGTDEVFCLIDPCETSRCPAFPEARCASDFCGGCNARYYMGDEEVTEDCAVPECPADVPTVSCLFNPCEHTTCTRYPEARCVPDYCGGCSAKFYNDEDEVTDECESRTLPPVLEYVSCPALNPDEFGTCEERCGDDDDCEEGEKCCSNGCGRVCRDDTIILPYYGHPQECPTTSGLVGTVCVALCQYDSDCVGDKLCCAAGCEKTCTTPVRSSNPCKVLANLSPTTIGAYIPQCDDDGNFSPVQCYASTGYCWCVNPETGIPVGGVSRPGQDLECASCSYNGQTYYPGQNFPSSDGCNECECTSRDGVICTEIACPTCSLDPDSGTCDGYNPAYYYNSELEQCERFIYSGCGGNNNKFKTARDCLQSCQPDSICLLDPVPLRDNCEQTGISFFYNSTAGQCEAFAVGDSDCYDANENSFDDPRACLSSCDPDNVGPTDSTGVECYDIECDIPECGPGVVPISDDEHCCPYCPPEETCEDDEKQCNDGSCIRADYVCDGFDDCPDGEDEPRDDCRVICPFRCNDGVCIPEEYVCDEWLDCRAGEDETQCADPPIDIPHYDPPLTCPDPTDLIGICEEQCRGNSDCPEEELCCSTGCGRSCMEGVPVTPLCRAIREEVLNRSLIGSYVPQCVDDGSFSPVQCWGSTGYCWCVNTRSGEAVTEPVNFEPNCNDACVANDERTFAIGDSYTAEDGCNTCLCTAIGAICTAVPCVCRVGDRVLANGDSFSDDCSECTCQFGQLNCMRRVCTTPPQPGMRVTMPFNGDFDRIMQNEDDFRRETIRTILMRYRDPLGLMQEQITVSELRKGSVIVVVDIVETDNQTLGANITILITQMQQDYEAGGLVIRYDSEILQPDGQFESSVQEDDEEEEDDEGLSGGEIIIIVVVVVAGLVIVTLIVAGVVLIVMRKTKHKEGSSPVRATHINPYTAEHESVEMKVPLDSPVA